MSWPRSRTKTCVIAAMVPTASASAYIGNHASKATGSHCQCSARPISGSIASTSRKPPKCSTKGVVARAAISTAGGTATLPSRPACSTSDPEARDTPSAKAIQGHMPSARKAT
jgi:hypothetical protein